MNMPNRFVRFCLGTSLLIAGVLTPRLAWAQRSCESLTSLALPNTTITSATSVPAGPFTTPPGPDGKTKTAAVPAFCRVAGVIAPTPDSKIKFETWLPTDTWNGKFLDLGNGGFAGFLVYPGMIVMVNRGFATASTDDGHTGMLDATWAIGHPEKVKDFGFRAVHETAEKSEAIVKAFYGKNLAHSYFNGCSDGGREALMEAQRYPDDFDGIVAGAPANSWTHQFVGFIWDEQATAVDPASFIPPEKLPIIQAAALSQCSTLEGASDGILENPRQCHVDLAKIKCPDADAPNCLTAPQVEAARKIYTGPKNPRTGEQIYPGYQPGSEADPYNWKAWITGATPGTAIQFFFGNAFFADMVFENPKWNFRSLDFDKDVKLTDDKMGPIVNSIDPDLSRFRARGGKLIEYHGWADGAIAPTDSVDYYEKVMQKTAGTADTKKPGQNGSELQQTQAFYRLFMVPGMGHCFTGDGANNFGNSYDVPNPQTDAEHDVIGALDRWVTSGAAPEKIIATKFVEDNPEKGVARTHPLCPYPQEAKYMGKGAKTDAANFTCERPSADSKAKSK
jgi:Tannase and feruloyl esterase